MNKTLWTPIDSKCEFLINEKGEFLGVHKKSKEYEGVPDEEVFAQEKAKAHAKQIQIQEAEALMQQILEEPLEEQI